MENHIHVSGLILLPSALLASFCTADGLHLLSKKAFLSRCNQIWSALGSRVFTGHSFCIGGTTELLIRGVPPDVVKSVGRWSSDSFLRYWRSTDEVAHIHIEGIDGVSRSGCRQGLLPGSLALGGSPFPALPR